MNYRHLAVGVLLSLSGCAPTPQQQTKAPLAGAAIGGPFALTDQNGRAVTDRTFDGQYRIVYFGYTFCPDVCPLDMQNVGAGLRKLEASDPALAKRVTPIFITVDPKRDTPAVLKQFVAAFHPRLVGLTGSTDAIGKVAKEYAIFYKADPETAGGGYIVQHSRQAYLMDPDGKPLALLPQDGTPDQIAAEIKRWAHA